MKSRGIWTEPGDSGVSWSLGGSPDAATLRPTPSHKDRSSPDQPTNCRHPEPPPLLPPPLPPSPSPSSAPPTATAKSPTLLLILEIYGRPPAHMAL
ncbi:hypothetical protein QLX08_001341 [Tetragonisca angustula]|uniref:Uncharacterized protein n=1 Tax=Tetragonisca angustula TaxID=166442 RepID=A0AAW1AF30_9HYME